MAITKAFNLKRTLLKDPVQWLTSQRRFRQFLHQIGLRPLGHSTLLWFREASDFHTRVTLRNYFSLNYRMPNPVFECRLFDSEGNLVKQWREKVEADQTLVLDSRDVAQRHALSGGFEGTLSIEIQDKELFPPRYLRVNVDYFNAGRFVTTVHDQGRLMKRASRDIQTLVTVFEDETLSTGVALFNCFRYGKTPAEFFATPELELVNAQGESLRKALDSIPSCGSRLVWVGDVFPNAREFLGNKPGGLKIHSNIAMPRCVSIVRSRDGKFSVNHTVGDHDPAIYERSLLHRSDIPVEQWAPVWMSFAKVTPEFDSQFAFFNNWVPRRVYALDVRVFDAEGKKVLDLPAALRLQPNETRVVSMAELLREKGVSAPFLGSIHARITPNEADELVPGPGMLQVNTIWRQSGSLAMTNNQSFWYCNAKTDIKDGMVQSRTRMFGRVVSNAEQSTVLVLLNPSSDPDYNKSSETAVTVTDAAGKNTLEQRLVIPPQGCVMTGFETLFPDLQSFLRKSNGVSSMVVQDKQVKLLGYLMLQDRATGAIGIDHLFGG